MEKHQPMKLVIVLGAAALAVVAAVVLGFIDFWHTEYGTETTVTFTVKQLDDQSTSSGHQYLVFTTDGRVFKNTDSTWHWKFDSSSVEAMLNDGDTYTCPVYGYRNPYNSQYQDLLDGCQQVPATAAQ